MEMFLGKFYKSFEFPNQKFLLKIEEFFFYLLNQSENIQIDLNQTVFKWIQILSKEIRSLNFICKIKFYFSQLN